MVDFSLSHLFLLLRSVFRQTPWEQQTGSAVGLSHVRIPLVDCTDKQTDAEIRVLVLCQNDVKSIKEHLRIRLSLGFANQKDTNALCVSNQNLDKRTKEGRKEGRNERKRTNERGNKEGRRKQRDASQQKAITI